MCAFNLAVLALSTLALTGDALQSEGSLTEHFTSIEAYAHTFLIRRDTPPTKEANLGKPELLPEEPIKGKSIVMLGMDRTLQPETIKGAASPCAFFDEGNCNLAVMIAHSDKLVLKDTDKLDLNAMNEGGAWADLNQHIDIHIVAEPPYHCPAFYVDCRTARLATFRNHLLDYTMTKFRDADYVAMLDLDGVVNWTPQTRGVILNVMTETNVDKWDGVFFWADRYYDWWAARCSPSSPNCWGHNYGTCYDRANYLCITNLGSQEDPNAFAQITSAFNGFALYKLKAIGDCRYDSRNKDPESNRPDDCEHVAFNTCLEKSGKKLMINGGQLNVNEDVGPHKL